MEPRCAVKETGTTYTNFRLPITSLIPQEPMCVNPRCRAYFLDVRKLFPVPHQMTPDRGWM
jgi:hypothetical protein